MNTRALRRASPNEAIDAQQYDKATRRNRRAHAAAARAYANALIQPSVHSGLRGMPLIEIDGVWAPLDYLHSDRKV